MRLSTLRNPDHPRVGGEHHVNKLLPTVHAGSSPRGRGTLILQGLHLYLYEPVHPRVGGEHSLCPRRVYTEPVRRIIPAWAGNTRRAADIG